MPASRHSILLVEDNPDDVLLLQRAAKPARMQGLMQVVSCGEDAVAYLNGSGVYTDRSTFPIPTVLLLDLRLPGLSGFEVLSWVRHQPRFKKMHVVVLTGSARSIDVYRAFELGADGYLVKPVTPVAFAEVLRNLGSPALGSFSHLLTPLENSVSL